MTTREYMVMDMNNWCKFYVNKISLEMTMTILPKKRIYCVYYTYMVCQHLKNIKK